MTISGHTSASTLRISPRLRYVCVLTVRKAPKCSSHSSPYPSYSPLQEIQTDKLVGSSRRVSSLDHEGITTAGHILPDPKRSSTLQEQDMHHYTSVWVFRVQTPPYPQLICFRFFPALECPDVMSVSL